MPAPTRRFPTPWTVHNNDDSYWVQDGDGSQFGFIYFRDRPLVGTDNSGRLTRDEARRIASNIARLPELLRRLAQNKPGTPP